MSYALHVVLESGPFTLHLESLLNLLETLRLNGGNGNA
jgi:hypothetical protein